MRNKRGRVIWKATAGALATAMVTATAQRRDRSRPSRRHDELLPIEWF